MIWYIYDIYDIYMIYLYTWYIFICIYIYGIYMVYMVYMVWYIYGIYMVYIYIYGVYIYIYIWYIYIYIHMFDIHMFWIVLICMYVYIYIYYTDYVGIYWGSLDSSSFAAARLVVWSPALSQWLDLRAASQKGNPKQRFQGWWKLPGGVWGVCPRVHLGPRRMRKNHRRGSLLCIPPLLTFWWSSKFHEGRSINLAYRVDDS